MLHHSLNGCVPPQDEIEQSILDVLILLSIRTGMQKLTEENWKTFYARINMLETLNGFLISSFDGEKVIGHSIEPKDVRRWIGISTNVSKVTDIKFLKSLRHELVDRIIRANREVK